jgi:hypothetical protein
MRPMQSLSRAKIAGELGAPARCSLAERSYAEAQRISFPSLLLHCDHRMDGVHCWPASRSEVTIGAGEAIFDTADCLDLPETMADDDCDGIAR